MKTNTELLDKATPGAARAGLGRALSDVVTNQNVLIAKYNALLAKLDADDGITDTDYAETLSATTATPIDQR